MPRDVSCLRCLLKNRVMEEEGMVVGGSDLSTKIVCAGKERFSKSLSTQERNQMECCISFARKKGKVGGSNYFRWCHPKCVDFEGCNYLVGHSGREDEVGGEGEVDFEVSPNRCEGGSKMKDCIFGVNCWTLW